MSPFTATEFMDRLRDEHITIACGVPTMWNAMLQVTGATPQAISPTYDWPARAAPLFPVR